MSICNYRLCHIPVKCGRPIKKSDHIRPTYLGISINDQVDGRRSENRDRSALISNQKHFLLTTSTSYVFPCLSTLNGKPYWKTSWQWCCLHATQHKKVAVNSELILVSFLMFLFHNSCHNFHASVEYNCRSIILLCFPQCLVVATAHWH